MVKNGKVGLLYEKSGEVLNIVTTSSYLIAAIIPATLGLCP